MARRGLTLTLRAIGILEAEALRHLPWQYRYPPTFVVGVPRSGTTLTGLVLTNSYRWAYIPAVANRYPNACITVTAFARVFARRYQATYTSSYGRVDGPLAPSDGWEVFHRWFPRYVLDEPVKYQRIDELRGTVAALERIFGGPFILKNNNTTTRIPVLRQLFPDAFWVHVHRDPVDTGLSLLEARQHFHVPPNEWWSAAPPEYWNRRFTDEVDQVAHQVVGLEWYLNDQLADLPESRRLRVSYQDVCADPLALLRRVADCYASVGVPLQPLAEPPATFDFRVPGAGPTQREALASAIHRLQENLATG